MASWSIDRSIDVWFPLELRRLRTSKGGGRRRRCEAQGCRNHKALLRSCWCGAFTACVVYKVGITNSESQHPTGSGLKPVRFRFSWFWSRSGLTRPDVLSINSVLAARIQIGLKFSELHDYFLRIELTWHYYSVIKKQMRTLVNMTLLQYIKKSKVIKIRSNFI